MVMLNQYVHFHKIHRIFVCTLESEKHQITGNYAVDSLSLEAKRKQLCARAHTCVHTHTNTHIHIAWPSQTPKWVCTHTAQSLTLAHAPRPHSHAHTPNILTAPQATFLPHRPTPLHAPVPYSHTSASHLGAVIWAPRRAAMSRGSSDRPDPRGQCYRPSAVTLGLGWGKSCVDTYPQGPGCRWRGCHYGGWLRTWPGTGLLQGSLGEALDPSRVPVI